jgi:hypothetical protein
MYSGRIIAGPVNVRGKVFFVHTIIDGKTLEEVAKHSIEPAQGQGKRI